MHLADLISRGAAVPWAEGSKLPWHDPGFSERMLREHLSQEHDQASRRTAAIDRHVAWLHHVVMRDTPGRVLDLGCGPGLYTSKLARLGHTCVGVDFSPASIAHARAEAQREGLACRYDLADLRACRVDGSFGAVLMISGELNTFTPDDARAILAVARRSLAAPGALVLEVHTEAFVREIGSRPRGWHTADAGLFSDNPYLCLRESSWHPESRAAVERYFVIEDGTDRFTSYTSTAQAYSEPEYASLLDGAGFNGFERVPSLDGRPASSDEGLFVLVARI